jgi:thiamine pyrophosphokinase
LETGSLTYQAERKAGAFDPQDLIRAIPAEGRPWLQGTVTSPDGGDLFMRNTRVMIFVNGELCNPEAMQAILRPDDFLIAADGGVYHLLSLGLLPKVLIGDLDSVAEDDLPGLEAQGVKIMRYPVEKDETDLELALQYARSQGFHRIRIVAGLGGRLDQTLGNVFLLSNRDLSRCDIRLDDGCEEVLLIQKQAILEGQPGDRISLLPLGDTAYEVSAQGLKYPLESETLWADRTRGISNEMVANEALITLKRGQLLCIHTRKIQPSHE